MLLNVKCAAMDICYVSSFEEVEGAYWFGPVCVSVCPLRSAYGQEWLEIGS